MRAYLCILLFLLLTGMSCASQQRQVKVYADREHSDSALVYAIPTGVAPITKIIKPEIYNQWWADVMLCSHLTINPETRDRIQYYAVNSEGFVLEGMKDGGTLRFAGYSEVWDDKMFLIFNHLSDPMLVKHEMLHFLMYHNGVPMGHPPELFLGCGLLPG